VREHDVVSLLTQALAEMPCRGTQAGRTHRSMAAERRERGVARTVEAGCTRAHGVLVAQPIELGRELERDELGTAPLAPADEMQDAHRVHRVMRAGARG
jgi:hypothetical protein